MATSAVQSRTIAFIGLGIMGSLMAANLVRAGHTVIGYNRSRPAGRCARRSACGRRKLG
jgi:2-hydroxy-3-oxopropionate reductase